MAVMTIAVIAIAASQSEPVKKAIEQKLRQGIDAANQAAERVGQEAQKIKNWMLNENAENGGDADGKKEGAHAPKGQTDAAVNGLTGGLQNETDEKGRPVSGHYVKPGGDAQKDLDSLPGDVGKNGQKTLPDGSVAGVHTSTTTGADTLHIHRPSGSRDIKIRYPEKVE